MSRRDHHLLRSGGWFINSAGYVMRELPSGGGRRVVVYLHRVILHAKRGEFVDHIDGDPLNNRRSNIRIVSTATNVQRGRKGFGKSKFLGVSPKGRGWQAKVSNKSIGTFRTEREAALAYNSVVLTRHGRHCAVNEVS